MLNIAILGYGTVGSGVYEIATQNADNIAEKCKTRINVKKILDTRDFPGDPAEKLFVKDFDSILNDAGISIVVECIGGLNPAYEYTKALLEKGKSVVTSNKAVVAEHGQELVDIAAKNNAQYLFEASVGSVIPIIRPLATSIIAGPITEIMGILNGTTNYILTRMLRNNESFNDALKMAQKEGYAEYDPTEDIEGYDAARKIAILAWLAFGKLGKDAYWKNMPITGVTKITQEDLRKADAEGCVLKLIGQAKLVNGKVECKVEPMQIPKTSPLANVDDVFNAIVVRGEYAGELMFYGRGAGKLPAADAMMADVMNICLQ